MIYIDTSVALAHLLGEDRFPAPGFWEHTLVSSRLLEYELWVRLNARGLSRSHDEAARALLGRVAMVEIMPEIVSRALEPFPVRLRTLDALHLASLEFLRSEGQHTQLASYDDRMLEAADKLGIQAFPL